MPIDPRRAQVVFLAAVESDRPAERADIPDRVYSGDMGLRERVEVLLRAYDQPDSLFDQPIVGPTIDGIVPGTGPEDNGEGNGAESSGGASETSDPTIGPPSSGFSPAVSHHHDGIFILFSIFSTATDTDGACKDSNTVLMAMSRPHNGG
jgi:hypothetical protein